MKQYILIIKSSGQPAPSTGEAGDHVAKYIAWSNQLKESGKLITADGLTDEVRILTSPEKPAQITDGPYVETKEMIGGYYIYTAENFAEAEQIARGCPALESGEVIELREQMDYN